jgi:hypothetical protein
MLNVHKKKHIENNNENRVGYLRRNTIFGSFSKKRVSFKISLYIERRGIGD